VINDGSTDRTLSRLIDDFRLYRSGRRVKGELDAGEINAVYESRDPIPLVVIDKANGGKAEALNVGIAASSRELIAVVDADSLLEPDALLHMVRPFLEDDQVVAAGGIVRVVNGCQVRRGQVTKVATPWTPLALFQSVEYLRAFLGGRVAFSFFNSLLVISGAFGLFRRESLIEAGGLSTTTVGEDMEITVRLHTQQRNGARSRVVFVPDPVCWTEVPESPAVLYRQRNRWQRGTVETVMSHRKVLFDRKLGALSWFGLPYFLMFEMLGPAVETTGYIVTFLGFALGLLSVEVAFLFFLVSVLFSIVLSMGAVVLEELTARRYPSIWDVARLLGAAILENFGYRQLMTLWRAKGLIDGLAGKTGWGKMERRGFQNV
jgi:cellulose synthase/poly-beta-1,6-N-acetylglucosamine synthase-like glycosyltransferase